MTSRKELEAIYSEFVKAEEEKNEEASFNALEKMIMADCPLHAQKYFLNKMMVKAK